MVEKLFSDSKKYVIAILGYFVIHDFLAIIITNVFIWFVNITRNIDFATLPDGDLKTSIKIEAISFVNIIVSIVLVIFLYFLFKSELKVDWKEFKINVQKIIFMTVILFIGMFAISTIISIIISSYVGDTVSENQTLIETIIESKYSYLMIINVVFLAPFVEELVFRKSLLEWIMKGYNKYIAIIGSGLAFGFIHIIADLGSFSLIDLVLVIPYVALGIVLGYAYVKGNRNILIPMGMHLLQNLISTLLILQT